LEHKDKPEGCIVPFVFSNGTGWVGFFCLNAPVRGHGWGGKLFQAGLDHFKKNGATVVGLDAVQEQVGTYSRRGFVEKARVRLMVRKGLKEQELAGGLEHVHGLKNRVTDLDHIPTRLLVASDLLHTGLERTKLWTKEAMFDRDGTTFGLAIVKEDVEEELEGWILVRNCDQGYRFGPLYSNTPENAEFLLRTAMRRLEAEDGSLIAEVWQENKEAVKIFEDAGWTYAGLEYHRMWLDGRVPEAQQPGGKAEKEMFAVFDAGEG
jgi:hypothetical protein